MAGFTVVDPGTGLPTLESFLRAYGQTLSAAIIPALRKGMDNNVLGLIKDATPFGRPGEPGVRAYYPEAGRLNGLQVRENWRIVLGQGLPDASSLPGTFVVGGLTSAHPGGIALLVGTRASHWTIQPRYLNPQYGRVPKHLKLGDNPDVLPEDTGLAARFSNRASYATSRRSPAARLRTAQRSSIIALARQQSAQSDLALLQPRYRVKQVNRDREKPDVIFQALVAKIFERANNTAAQEVLSQLGAQLTHGSGGLPSLTFTITDGGA